jgi:predicted component of type VI protein secretion system
MERVRIRLVVASGPNEGDEVPVYGAEFVIGRQAGCQFRPRGAGVAERHCAVVNRSGRLYLRNLNPSGTALAGQQVSGEMELNDGDIFQVGNWQLRLQISGKPPAKTKPPGAPSPAKTKPPSAPSAQRKILIGPKERAQVLLRQREWDAMQARKKSAVAPPPPPPASRASKWWLPAAGGGAAVLLAVTFFVLRSPTPGPARLSAPPMVAVHEASPGLPAGPRPPRRRAAAPAGVPAEVPTSPSSASSPP